MARWTQSGKSTPNQPLRRTLNLWAKKCGANTICQDCANDTQPTLCQRRANICVLSGLCTLWEHSSNYSWYSTNTQHEYKIRRILKKKIKRLLLYIRTKANFHLQYVCASYLWHVTLHTAWSLRSLKLQSAYVQAYPEGLCFVIQGYL